MRRNDHIIAGVFPDRESADRAYEAVTRRGISADQVSVLMKDETRERFYSEEYGERRGERTGTAEKVHEERKTAEGTGVGGAIGAGLGALITAALAAGAPITIPGLLIAGPIAGALTGAGMGGVTGGIIGALIGSGIKEEVAEEYKGDIERGHITLAVSTPDEEDARYIENEWRKYGTKVRRDEQLRETVSRSSWE
ncbi:MAG TPA: DUF1269 domain-containing protein [Acidobacteriota bacterium]|nr:DUF1269 domain-containing protein [Acidobacteriota bacterium]